MYCVPYADKLCDDVVCIPLFIIHSILDELYNQADFEP
jgi:hypothetical protein